MRTPSELSPARTAIAAAIDRAELVELVLALCKVVTVVCVTLIASARIRNCGVARAWR